MARGPEKSARETSKAKNEVTAGLKTRANHEAGDAKSGASSTADLLKTQHQELQAILAKRSDANADRDAIVKEFAAVWLPHIAVEQEVLAPALSQAGSDEQKLVAGAIQKEIINLLLEDLLRGGSREFGQAKLEALAKQFDAHVEEAGAEDTGLFAIVSLAERSNPGLNAQMKARYERHKSRFANMDESIGEARVLLAPRRLSVSASSQRNRREYEMSRYSDNIRERDDQGRFMSDGDNGYSRGSPSAGRDRDEQGRFTSEGGGYPRGRYEDDDRRYSRGGPERDDNGRFMSESGSQSRGRYDDEDQRYSRRSTGRERDDEGRFMSDNGSSRGRFQGDDEHYGPRSLGSMGRDRDEDGRFARRGGSYEGSGRDSDGPSDSSRWGNQRHGERGWYGDPEGHSEASRRGWEGREGGNTPRYEERSRRYDEAPSRSRPQYAGDRDYRRSDDYERGNGGREHGGWSGDPEGHSEASRRGWQNRR
jgi:hypothetical protein